MTNPTTPPPGPEGQDPSEPVMDRRAKADRRTGADRRARKDDAAPERRQGADRRQGDRRQGSRPPRNINQYDMSPDVLEFVNAVNRHREGSGNRFPSAGDILQILKDLGYEKRA